MPHKPLYRMACMAPHVLSNQKLQHPRANPRHFTIFCAREVGNLTFALVEWGKLKLSFRFQMIFFFRAPKSLTALNTCLDKMEEFKGKDIAYLSDWLTKKGLQRNFSWLMHVFSYYRVVNVVRFHSPISFLKTD